MEITKNLRVHEGYFFILKLKNRKATITEFRAEDHIEQKIGYYNNVVSVNIHANRKGIYNGKPHMFELFIARFTKEGEVRVKEIRLHGSRWGKVLNVTSDILVGGL